MKFQPGKSGNPSGRPKALFDIQSQVREQTPENIARLIYWRDQNEDPQVSLRATIALHEIAWGKPAQAVQLNGDMTHKADDSVTAMLADIRKARENFGQIAG